MPLSCNYDCYEVSGDYGEWIYSSEEMDFEVLATTRAKRCISCRKLIKVGGTCLRHSRYRWPYNEVEEKITGNHPDCDEPEIPMAPHYQCERCGEIWFNLFDAGYECLSPQENMEAALSEYHDLTGFIKEEKG